jgi:hypothetical protein
VAGRQEDVGADERAAAKDVRARAVGDVVGQERPHVGVPVAVRLAERDRTGGCRREDQSRRYHGRGQESCGSSHGGVPPSAACQDRVSSLLPARG